MYPKTFIKDENMNPNPGGAPTDEEARVKRELGTMVQEIPPELVLKYPPPAQLAMPLLPYQREGLAWMCEQEAKENCNGGILADEMGMGKTIQTVSLITKKLQREKNPTLIVCTTTAMLQWEAETMKYLKPGTVKIFLYHGKSKISAKELRNYDIVLTTYRTLEAEYRKELDRLKMQCPYCKRKWLPELLYSHTEKCPKRPRTTWTYDASGRANYGGSAHQPSATSSSSSSSSSSSWTRHRPSVASSSGHSLQRNLFGGEDRPLPEGGGLREDRALPQTCGAPSHYHQHNHQGTGKSIQEFFTGPPAWKGREQPRVKKEDTGSGQGGSKDWFETLRSLRAKIEHGRDARASGGSHPSAITRTSPYTRPSLGSTTSSAMRPSVGSTAGGPMRNRLSLHLPPRPTTTTTAGPLNSHDSGPTWRLGSKEARYESRDSLTRPSVTGEQSSFGESRAPSIWRTGDHGHGDGRMSNKWGPAIAVKEEGEPMIAQPKPNSPLRDCTNLGYTKVENESSWDTRLGGWQAKAEPITQKDLFFSAMPRADGDAGSGMLSGRASGAKRMMYSPPVKRGGLPGRRSEHEESPLLGFGKRIKAEEMESGKENVDANARDIPSLYQSGAMRPSPQCGAVPRLSAFGTTSDRAGPDWSKATVSISRPAEQRGAGARRAEAAAERARRRVRSRRRQRGQACIEDSSDETGTDRSDLEDLLRRAGFLHGLRWERIVLDEAHKIKAAGPRPPRPRVPCGRGSGGVCLAPLSRIRFLRVLPEGARMCDWEGCDCVLLDHPIENCKACGHPRISHYIYFTRFIANPIKSYGFDVFEGAEGLRLLRSRVLKRLMLRRTKAEKQVEVRLPELTSAVHTLPMKPKDREVYDNLFELYQARIRGYLRRNEMGEHMVEVLSLIVKLRLAANHKYLADTKDEEGARRCDMCQDEIFSGDSGDALVWMDCGHEFHRDCVGAAAVTSISVSFENSLLQCPVCGGKSMLHRSWVRFLAARELLHRDQPF
ncbi:hypothetical protein FOL46_009316, partial [Perkinsus olseni]